MKKTTIGFVVLCTIGFFSCVKKDVSGGSSQPTLNVFAGVDQTIKLPIDSAVLAGSVSSSAGATLTYQWTQFSGPTTAVIGSAATVGSTMRTLRTGTYNFVLKVTSSIGSLTATDTVAVTVQAQNPPTVNAGDDQAITMPKDSTTLTGTAAGGAPGITIASYAWTQISGPSTATIVSTSTASTLVKAMQLGTYKFQLKATDNFGSSVMDTVAVLVNNAQISLSMQPGNNPDEFYLNTLGSFGGAAILCAEYWTVNSNPMTLRAMFKFDLSGIANPSRVKILSAKLSLYSHPAPTDGNLIDANFGSNNALLIQRVTAPWSKATTTFANQPATSTSDQLLMPQATSSRQDLIDMDVTTMVQGMLTNGNNGFLIKLQNETVLYNSRLFCSSLYPDASKRPALKIVYEYIN
jgi:hypothetical protein